MWLSVLVTVLVGYMLGNLNGAVSMSNLLAKQDVREHGSGNAGLTNFLRMFSPIKALLVIAIDMLKAVVACFAGKLLLEPYGYGQEGLMLGAVMVNLGHDFPALLGFRGGKGVLAGFAAALVADWQCALVVLAVFALCLLVTRYVSLSSILGALAFSVSFAVAHHDNLFVAVTGALLGLFVVFMHRANIARLLKGTEKKATFSQFRRNK